MAENPRTKEIAHRLKDVGNAHFEYEQSVLKGVYDEQWSDWYADYLLAHDWNTLFTRVWIAAELATTLRQLDVEYREQAPQESWVRHYANRFAEMA